MTISLSNHDNIIFHSFHPLVPRAVFLPDLLEEFLQLMIDKNLQVEAKETYSAWYEIVGTKGVWRRTPPYHTTGPQTTRTHHHPTKDLHPHNLDVLICSHPITNLSLSHNSRFSRQLERYKFCDAQTFRTRIEIFYLVSEQHFCVGFSSRW